MGIESRWKFCGSCKRGGLDNAQKESCWEDPDILKNNQIKRIIET